MTSSPLMTSSALSDFTATSCLPPFKKRKLGEHPKNSLVANLFPHQQFLPGAMYPLLKTNPLPLFPGLPNLSNQHLSSTLDRVTSSLSHVTSSLSHVTSSLPVITSSGGLSFTPLLFRQFPNAGSLTSPTGLFSKPLVHTTFPLVERASKLIEKKQNQTCIENESGTFSSDILSNTN